mmetsp:Transcript_25544/g.46494  ORF Transcript_25544/g.46494 Transcript_25544/m.46494 type:complete len:926 (-) Transcript_25544:399-3176(-)|eukprot:CAMPEP_0175071588 /NCGR_PEP_ID=MMETSP0052_2-20121109/19327_1 /TAXON_ID=51329 ORGANISM="Polytomella parva, Strain SAG 63-3" /NCGR_SAMPLE_ID=MMETSP0052_2 /ASSEMBLY_ACC=CAM_ASM_000194 /LENGTH=925 /DNA_ID=CAMNT_0016338777 /DNA_START=141 /DNA_END=2918 /DNA_ORIENTATION=+
MALTAQDSMAPLRGPKKKDEDGDDETEFSPFYGIDKSIVLQEARVFNDTQIDPRKCQQVITKLLYLIHQGEQFTKKEASEVFFGVTKLFQNHDPNLRRMVYLCIRDICPGTDEVIIVTSSLMKDMNSRTDLYRSNAVRVLCDIIDSQLLVQVERYLKQAIVDKSPVVASSALVSAMHLLKNNADIVRRWSSEAQEASLNNRSPMVQFHAIALLHAMRANDRLAVSKLVSSLTKASVKCPLAQCLLVRYVAQVAQDSADSLEGANNANVIRPYFDLLESSLRHKSEVVIFEAARAICSLKDVTLRELTPAITVLQLFLSSSKPVMRFAAVRALSRVALTHPTAVANCNIDLESLIGDSNRSVATLAITTLLKTGNENNVDKLLKQIGGFMADIPDEFKVVVVQAIQSLCFKFPSKQRLMMNFLSSILREEGGFEFKKAIVGSILALIKEVPDAKEAGLNHLCEFIEDCEFTFLSVQVLHVLGEDGPKTKDPNKYIRYIYNRTILENATVRAAAVSALASFGIQVESLRARVLTLLKRALSDTDDEVRDRATLHHCQLQTLTLTAAAAAAEVTPVLNVDPNALEKKLQEYLAGPCDKPFDLNVVPKAVVSSSAAAAAAAGFGSGVTSAATGTAAAAAATGSGAAGGGFLPNGVGAVDGSASPYAGLLASIPQLATLGPVFKSCAPVRLTEADTEYVVVCVKHIFESHLVLQFDCRNTITEQVLENVSVAVDVAEAEDLEEDFVIPLAVMPTDGVDRCFSILRRRDDCLAVGKVVNLLKFRIKEIDPSTGEAEEEGFEDEYQLEDLEVSPSDYIRPVAVPNFRKAWTEMDPSTEKADEYGLGPREGLAEAVEAVTNILGMKPCEGTDAVPPNARSHSVLLSGVCVGNQQVLVRLALGIDASRNVAMKLIVRSDSPELSETIHSIIQQA